MTNRVFTLPSGRTVVLKAPSHDVLSELHGLKVFFVDRTAHDLKMEQMRRDLMVHGPDHKPLSGLEQMQTSTPQMREFINDSVLIRKQARQEILGTLFDPGTKIIGTPKELSVNPAFTALLEERQYSTRGLTHPRDTFSNSLDSFNGKAKKLKIRHKPDRNRVLTCGGLRGMLSQLKASNPTAEMVPAKGDMVLIGTRLCVIKKVKN